MDIYNVPTIQNSVNTKSFFPAIIIRGIKGLPMIIHLQSQSPDVTDYSCWSRDPT
jgi:hypothetical protein